MEDDISLKMDAYRTSKGWKEKVDVTILKVIDPCHFLIKEAPSMHMSDCARAFLETECKLREYMSKQDVKPLNRGPPELGARVLVRKPGGSDWYRAIVNQILETLQGYRIEVTLIDYGETLLVEQRFIRSAPARVFAVPAQSVELVLPGLKPCTLALDEMAVMVRCPADVWDTAAVEYVNALVARAGAAQAHVFGHTKSGKLYGKLTVRYGDNTICIAQDLVTKAYAFLERVSAADWDDKDRVPQTQSTSPSFPVMPAEELLVQKQKQRQQEQAMAAAMERVLYGTKSSSRTSTPLTPFLDDAVKTRIPEDTSGKKGQVPEKLSQNFHSSIGSVLLDGASLPSTNISPVPSFSSETMPFPDLETSTIASEQLACSRGRGHAPLLHTDGVGKMNVARSSLPRPGDVRTDVQFGFRGRLLVAAPDASSYHGFRRARNISQPCLSPGGGAVTVSSSKGVDSDVPKVFPKFGVERDVHWNITEDKSALSELKSEGSAERSSEQSPGSSSSYHSDNRYPSPSESEKSIMSPGCAKLIALLQQEQYPPKKNATALTQRNAVGPGPPQIPLGQSSALPSMPSQPIAFVLAHPEAPTNCVTSERSPSRASVSSELRAKKLKQLLSRTCDGTALGETRSSSPTSSYSSTTAHSNTPLPDPLEHQASRLAAKLRSMSPSKFVIGSGDAEVKVKAAECARGVRCPEQGASLSAAGMHKGLRIRRTVAELLSLSLDPEKQGIQQGSSVTRVDGQLQRAGGDGDAETIAPVEQSEKEGESVQPGSYDDFMKACSVEDDEEFNQAEEESKWELQFSSRGNHQELVDLNICHDNDDFRCRDFNSFSSIPQDLEPYTQFEGEVNFNTSFEPSHWAARIESKLIRALSHGSAPPRPILSLDHAHFPDSLKQHLESLGFKGPSCVQSVAWPSVLSGRTLVEVASPNSGKTLSYLLPLLSRVMSESDYQDLPTSSGPVVLVLSSTWKGAQRIYDQLKVLIQDNRAPKCCVLYGGGSEAGKEVQLANGCDFLIATPMSFLRVLRTYSGTITNLRRCCHLVLDDGERLVEEFTEEVSSTLVEYWSAVRQRASRCLLNQIIVCSTRWTAGMQSLLRLLMEQQSPLVLFTSFFEAAVYGQVPTFAHFVDARRKNEVLLGLVEGCAGKKTVICTSSYESAVVVHKLLELNCIYALLLHDKMIMTQIWDVAHEWASPHNSHSIPILVAMDNVLSWANVRDAAAIIHYDVPELSKFNFGFRFSCLAQRMRSFNSKCQEYDAVDVKEKPVAHLLLTPEDQTLSVPLVNFLKRLGSKIPPGLQELADKELETRTLDKQLPLCPNLKAFGRCETLELGSLALCRNRHQLSAHLDHPKQYDFLPTRGEVKMFITRVVDASHFYGWVLEHWEPSGAEKRGGEKRVVHTQFLTLMMDLGMYLAKPGNLKNVEDGEIPAVGSVYALEVKEGHYQRVRVTSVAHGRVLEVGEPLRVEVFHMDHGFSSMTSARCLLHLPQSLASQPPYAVEVFCCRIQPQDRDTSWTFQADFAAYNLVAEKELYGKVALCMGNTLWLDPLVIRKRLETLGVMVNEKHVRSYLIQRGMACDNPHHLTRLRDAAEKAGIPVPPMEVMQQTSADASEQSVQSPACAFLEMDEDNVVYLWKVISPHHFYVQREKFSSCLEDLEDEIQKQLAAGKLRKLKAVRVGILCIAPFSNIRFYRGQVDEVSEDGGSVRVFFPDYGDTIDCPQKDLYHVEPWMVLLPFQGIKCSLAGVAPPKGGWHPNAAARLEDMSYNEADLNKQLLVKVLRRIEGSRLRSVCYEVLLYDTTSGHGISLADELVRQGLAEAVEIAVPDVDLANGASQTPFSVLTAAADRRSDIMFDDVDLEPEDQVCVEAMKEHMDKVYGEMCNHLLKQRLTNQKGAQDVPQQDTAEKEVTAEGVSNKPKNSSVLLPIARQPPPLDFCGRSRRSKQPILKWWQDREHVYLDILVAEVKTFTFTVRSRLMVFRTKVEGCRYEVYEELYAKVATKSCIAEAKLYTVGVVLKKKVVGLEWQALTNRGYKVNYIQYNLDHIVDSDEEQVDENCNLYPPGYEKPSTILPYDPVAHEDAVLDKETREEHVNAPVDDLYDDCDPNDPFA